jgi:hypothetical protein
MSDERPISNRERVMRPRKGSIGYCVCDRWQITRGQKCPYCKRVMKRKALKKDTNA